MTQQWNMETKSELSQKILDTADMALEFAVKKGASTSEISINQGEGISVAVRQGQVETVEHHRDKCLGITVYFGHRSGSATSTDFSRIAIESAVQSACNIARHTEEDFCNGLADVDLLATEFPDLDLYFPWNLEISDAISIAVRCEQAALSADSRISNTDGSTVASHVGTALYANSNGFRGVSHGSRHNISCCVIAGEGIDMQRDYWYDSRRDPGELCCPEEIGVETAKRTLRRLNARKIKTIKSPVLYEPSVASSLLSHFISAVNGSSLYRKASFLLDKKGEKIFSEKVRIHEQPHLLKASGSAVFDNEGVATAPRDLVTQGILQGYVLNSYSARKLELQTTGNAGGVHNLTIDSTGGDFKDLMQEMGSGLVVSELIGFGVNNVTGDYSRGAFGFWVENGEIQFPVQEFTVAGNLAEMFQGIESVGSDVDERKSIRSGSILIDTMTIAGG